MSPCPICSGVGRPLLALPRQPIYQHPVDDGVEVPLPYTVDLKWLACVDCAHAWQPDFDIELLAGIYRNFYYTPAPDGMAVKFREDFLLALEKFGLMTRRRVLLEIGASSGDVLAELVQRTGAERAYAFEPNQENARVAKQRGLDVHEEFFTSTVAHKNLVSADLLYARHVVEHIFDLSDFFSGLNLASAPQALLVLETPSLDFHSERGSMDPFHIEHIHVFALRSLARLARTHGWGLQTSEVSTSGNLIAVFRKGTSPIEVAAPALDGLQGCMESRRARLRTLIGDRPLVIWGAGSSGVSLVSTLEREPEMWTDGNPAKVGKRFVGLLTRIVNPEFAFNQVRMQGMQDPLLVIASSFVAEILPRVRELGWLGDVIDSAGNRL